MTGASNFGGLMATRFLLGSFEACVAPTFIAIVQMWYRRGEQTVRNAAWYAQLGVVNIVSHRIVKFCLICTVTDLRHPARKPAELWVSSHCLQHTKPLPDYIPILRGCHWYVFHHSDVESGFLTFLRSRLLSRRIHMAP